MKHKYLLLTRIGPTTLSNYCIFIDIADSSYNSFMAFDFAN